MKYCQDLSDEAGRHTAEILGTEIMENAEGTLSRSAFSNVRLPVKVGTGEGEVPEEHRSKVINWIAATMLKEYDTYAAFYLHAGHFWVRLSGQIYVALEDFMMPREFRTRVVPRDV